MGPLISVSATSQRIYKEYNKEDINVTLKRLWHNNVIFSYLNMNSIRNKFGE